MDDGTAFLYELATARSRMTFGKQTAPKETPPIKFGRDFVTPDEFRAGSCFAFSPDGTLLVRGGFDRTVHVWDIQTGKELAAFQGHDGAVTAVAFAPNGRTVASASADSTALIWDISKVNRPALPAKALKPSDFEKHWQALAGGDAATAFDAMRDLIAAPKEAIAWIEYRIKPAGPLDGKRIADLIAQLGNQQFKIRDKAANDLSQIGERIIPALDKALAANPPLETKRRLQDLRDKVTALRLEGERLRAYRAVEVLERIGTMEARQLLQTLAAGAPGAFLTTSAQAALNR